MDVATAAICFHHSGITTIERTHTQLDLREIKIEERRALRRNNELPDTDRVGSLAGHVLQIGSAGCETSGVGSHRQEVGVYSTGRRIDPFEIPVDIGALDLCPFSKLLHGIEEGNHLRAVLFAIRTKQLHSFIVRCLGIFGRGLQDGQVFCLIQIVLECLRSTVLSDIHIADDRLQLCSKIHKVRFGLCLLFLHEVGIEQDAVILHHAGENGSWAFDLFTDQAVLRDVVLKPFVERVVKLQCPVAIRTGIAAGIPCIWVELIKTVLANHILKFGEFNTVQVWHKGFKSAVTEITVLKIIF